MMPISGILLAFMFAVSTADDAAVKKLAAGNLEFTSNAYKKQVETVKGNFLICGISAKIVLSLLTQGAKGETKTELQHGISEDDDSVNSYRHLIPRLNQNDESLSLRSANKIYAANEFKILDSFKKIAEDPYRAGIENVNFGENTKAAGIINKWVSNQTNNKINDLISPDQLSANTGLVLVNTLYFNGQWAIPFDTHFTQKGVFYSTATESKDIDMMHNEGTYNYRRCGYYKAQFLEIPFVQSNISMYFILPEKKEGLSALEPHIKDILVPHRIHLRTVNVRIPKFVTKSNIEFTPILKSLGVEKVFDSRQSNLTGISKSQERLVVDFVTQQTYINVTESGVEAAAATAVGLGGSTAIDQKPPAIVFNADHPFLYYIRDNESGLILFTGKFSN